MTCRELGSVVPREMSAIEPRPLDDVRIAGAPVASVPVRRYRSAHTLSTHTQFLSNGNYVTSVTNASAPQNDGRPRRISAPSTVACTPCPASSTAPTMGDLAPAACATAAATG